MGDKPQSRFADKYFVFDKDLGRPQLPGDDAFARQNADGRAIPSLTDEQRYAFDLRGWLLVPGVLSEDEIEASKEHILRLHTDRDSLPEHQRSSLAGPCESLIDHPMVVAFMNEFVYHPFTDGIKTPPLGNQVCYGFRMEFSFSQYPPGRRRQVRPAQRQRHDARARRPPHLPRLSRPAHTCLTRALWELNPVGKRQGGTLFVSGSHKAAFTAPDSLGALDSPFWDTYECPAGSVLFFTEGVTHSSDIWRQDTPRVAIFNSYNTIGSRWHNWEPHPRLVAEMPALRQTLFRPVYVAGNLVRE